MGWGGDHRPTGSGIRPGVAQLSTTLATRSCVQSPAHTKSMPLADTSQLSCWCRFPPRLPEFHPAPTGSVLFPRPCCTEVFRCSLGLPDLLKRTPPFLCAAAVLQLGQLPPGPSISCPSSPEWQAMRLWGHWSLCTASSLFMNHELL